MGNNHKNWNWYSRTKSAEILDIESNIHYAKT